jgi:hypothetical protein
LKNIRYWGSDNEEFKISYIPSSDDARLPILPSTLGFTRHEIQVNWPPSKKNFIVCSLAGEGRVFFDGEWNPLPEGSVVYIPADVPIIYEPVDEKPWTTAYLTFGGSSSEGIIGDCAYIFREEKLSYIAEEIVKLKDNFDSPDWDSICFGALYRIIMSLRALIMERKEGSFTAGNTPSVLRKMQETIQYINERFCDDLSLGFLAEKARISEQYYFRLFKEITGTNFTSYLNSLRISHAFTTLLK